MNLFNGTWIDQQEVTITISGSGTAVTVNYSNGRGPFRGTTTNSPPQITVNFTDDGGNKTGTLINNNSQINWDNGTVWKSYYVRKNAWIDNNGGQFVNADGSYTDLYWYAKGVQVMQSRDLNDQNSWWFFAAIHGISVGLWKQFPAPPTIPTTPLPTKAIQDKFWNQCQHQSWFFPPWHRGYLIALEEQIRAAVIGLGGPATWALPYWNYFGPGNEYKLPPAFAELNLPDGSPNPLYVTARYGPNNDGNVYINLSQVNQACQKNTIYTGSNTNTPNPGYGGPVTGFWHGSGSSGNLESNPHNLVHTQVGGSGGLMSYPSSAGLDPIFYLHHSNIDRMWAAWNQVGNSNPTSADWLNGPASKGEREFVMPMPDGSSWVYTPDDVNSLSQLNYTYSDLAAGITFSQINVLTQRLSKLGAESIDVKSDANMDLGTQSELIGANDGQLLLGASGVRTTIKLDNSGKEKVSRSLLKASATNLPDKVYLQIEEVKGEMDGNILAVTVNHQLAGYVSLFGLQGASEVDGHHGGTGLTFLLDITDIIDNLHLENELNAGSLDVTIQPDNAIPQHEKITIGRVSIYREQLQ